MKKHHGFSLIELCLVLMIVGLLVGPFLAFVNLYLKEKARRITNENMLSLSLALGQYYDKFEHYPCPASLKSAAGEAGFGEEAACVATPAGEGENISTQSSGAGCAGGVCTATSKTGDKIRIGAIPHKALGIPFQSVVDGYGNKITYAVTERYATDSPQTHLGAISIIKSDGQSAVQPAGSAQFILISHGKDGKGSYTASGSPHAEKCTRDNAADAENCNNDDVFVDGQYSEKPGEHYYDDTVLYKMYSPTVLWQSSPFDDKNIYNASLGNVGIGVENPQQKLDIKGHVRALGSLYTQQVCDTEGADCFRPAIIGGSGMRCEKAGEVMVGIKENEPVCAPVTMENPKPDQCEEGFFAVGFTLTGKILCAVPAWTLQEGDIIEVDLNTLPAEPTE